MYRKTFLIISLTLFSAVLSIAQPGGNGAIERPKDNVKSEEVIYYYDEDSTMISARGRVNGAGFSDLGKKMGDWYFYDKKGEITEIAHYVRGYLHGKVVQYHDNGKKKNEGFFYWGVQDSLFRAWNYDGKLIEKGYWEHSRKVGKWEYKYSDGSPNIIEEYVDSIPHLIEFYSRDGKHMVKNGSGTKTEYHQAYKLLENRGYVLPEGARVKEKYTYKNGLPHGSFEEYHSNGNPSVFGEYQNGLKTGTWKYWHFNGRLVRLSNYKEDELHGDFERMFLHGDSKVIKDGDQTYVKGQVQVRGQYDEGAKTGTWEWFANDGSPDLKGDFVNDARDGEWKQWHLNGQLASKGYYEKDKKTGKWESWFPDGKLEAVGYFEDDLKTGDWKFYFETGELWKEGGFIAGLREGLWTTYYVDGKKVNEGVFTKGLEDGIWKSWYENGQLMDEGSFKLGKMDGPWKGWYSSGKTRYEGQRKNDLEAGHWKYYFEDGALYEEGDFKVFKRKNALSTAYEDLGVDYSEHVSANEYEYSRKHGHWTTYSQKDKQKTTEGNFDEGKKQGVWLHYNPGGKVVGVEISYKDGKLDGPSKNYTLKGKLVSEITYKEGIKHGDMKVYNKRGKVISHKVYKNGVLHKDELEGKKYKYK